MTVCFGTKLVVNIFRNRDKCKPNCLPLVEGVVFRVCLVLCCVGDGVVPRVWKELIRAARSGPTSRGAFVASLRC